MLRPLTIVYIGCSLFFFNACNETPDLPKRTSSNTSIGPVPSPENVPPPPTANTIPEKEPPVIYNDGSPHPKKTLRLQKVEDTNFSPEYMYPKTKKKEKKTESLTHATYPAHNKKNPAVTKEECVGMLGEAKFARYVEMLGSEAAALKRCAMLKAID
jgi:hypothetical protein